MPTVKKGNPNYAFQGSERLSVHPNDLTVNLTAQLDNNRRLREHMQNYLSARF
jgi:hypothetical protein